MLGNQFLTQFAVVLQQQFRKQDTIARFGGDEFVVLLPETASNQAQCVADRVENQFNHFVAKQYPHILSFGQKWTSFGVSSYPIDGTSIKKLMEAANRKMFQHKRNSKVSSSENSSNQVNDLGFRS